VADIGVLAPPGAIKPRRDQAPALSSPGAIKPWRYQDSRVRGKTRSNSAIKPQKARHLPFF